MKIARRIGCSNLVLILCSVVVLVRDVRGLDDWSDRDALLAIKSQVTKDPLGFLTSWNESADFCRWPGVTCGKRHRRVTVLDLRDQGLEGTLSPAIGNLTFLQMLSLWNNSFYGPIPPEIGRLSRVDVIYMQNNSFTGPFPINITGCLRLRYLYLYANNLSGEIPAEIDVFPNLLVLGISGNEFSGKIPASLANMSSLQGIHLSDNNLVGSVPPELGVLPNLQTLMLSTNNLSGTIPPSIYNITSLLRLDLSLNDFEGQVPPGIGTLLPDLQLIFLGGNRFSGPIPPTITNASGLVIVDMALNRLTGPVPQNFGNIKNLKHLNLADNPLGSDLSFLSSLSNCTNLERLWLAEARLVGALPGSVSNLSPGLISLWLSDNDLLGSIPHEISNLVNLTELSLGGNMLTGEIPNSISQLSKLQVINLTNNAVSGNIPISVGNLTQLSDLLIENNNLDGGIPESLVNCTSLKRVYLSGNRLSGVIPESVTGISLLSDLSLNRNSLWGSLPSTLGRMNNLNMLDVSSNKLSGEIPVTIGDCEVLVTIILAGNSLEGTIPSSFDQLRGLRLLDLSGNNLTGNIPVFLAKVSPGGYLNLSFNKFEGEVPHQGIFVNASTFSVLGNTGLCGGVETLQLPKCPAKDEEGKPASPKRLVVIIIGISLVAFAVLVIGTYAVISWRAKSRAKPSTALPLSELHLKVSYAELRQATDGFSSVNVIGEGSFGVVYRGILGEDLRMVAVKVMKSENQGALRNFTAECDALRHIRHRNLVKVVTSCSSIDFDGNDFKALVFEFLPNGNLENWLHPSSEQEQEKLTLLQRLNIAIGIADAVHYLHHECGMPIVHCDLKPSNVLLDEDFCAHVGDFGLARILSPSEIVSASIGIRGTLGYVAPEYSQGADVSTKGDVYSYGILLLEIFTGRRPTDSAFAKNHSLRNYVMAALPDQVMRVVDHSLVPNTSGSSVNGFGWYQDCLTSILQIAVACSAERPRDRTDIEDVSRELSHIKRECNRAGRRIRN